MTNITKTTTIDSMLPDSVICPDLPDGEGSFAGPSCAPISDTLLCWPRTQAGSVAVLPCFDELFGIKYDSSENATKICWPNATWNKYSNYTLCKELLNLTKEEAENSSWGVEVATHLYLVGYGLSLVALIFAVSIYTYYRELKCLRNTIHINLMLTYILADSMWIIMTLAHVSLEKNIPFCIASYTLYQYFQLTNFFWMFVEGLYLYLLVVKTFSGDGIRQNMCMIIGWVAPVVIILVWAIVKSIIENQQPAGVKEEALSQHCPWMVSLSIDWIYQGPAIFVLSLNVAFLCMIMVVLITKLRSANNVETQQYKKAAKALFVLIPLLGVTYLLMIVGPSSGPVAQAFSYARATMLSFQGLFVAICYCFLSNEVRNALRHHFQRWTNQRSLGGQGQQQRYYVHWAPRSRTESLRLYCRPTADAVAPEACNNGGPPVNGNNNCNHHAAAKEALVSEGTTTSIVSGSNNNHSGHNHFFARFKKNQI